MSWFHGKIQSSWNWHYRFKSYQIFENNNSNYIKKKNFEFNEIKKLKVFFFFLIFFGKLKVSLIIGGIWSQDTLTMTWCGQGPFLERSKAQMC